MFVGFNKLDATFVGALLIKNVNETPVNVDNGTSIAWASYGAAGLMLNGQGVGSKLSTQPGLYQYAVPATAENGYEVGQSYRLVFTASVNGTTVGQEQNFIVT